MAQEASRPPERWLLWLSFVGTPALWLGHFLLARWNGVRVITFSLGFGPKLLKFRRGDTEYCVSAIPLGGYVKMAGENAEDPRSGQPDEFLSKTKWERFQVLIMACASLRNAGTRRSSYSPSSENSVTVLGSKRFTAAPWLPTKFKYIHQLKRMKSERFFC